MNARTDSELLRDYAENASESAFAELVRRHIDLVYSSALRLVVDPHLAEDVSQATFATLAREGRHLTGRALLSGWLHRTALNLAAKLVRTEMRRRAREQEAYAMQTTQPEPDPGWKQVAPKLDAALDTLTESDRAVILLRYFEKKTASEIGATLKLSEEAAQKRVARAVERLRDLLAGQGVTLSATALGSLIATQAVFAAPAGLSTSVSAVALTGGAAAAGITPATLKLIVMSKLKVSVVSALIVGGLALPFLLQHQHLTRLREENQSLQERARQASVLRSENQKRLAQISDGGQSQALSGAQFSELLRLRNEVGRLRSASRQLAPVPGQPLTVRATSSEAMLPSSLEITGRITLKGTPPPAQVITPLKNDATCGKLWGAETPMTRVYVVGGAGELADVVIYIKGGLTTKKTDPAAPAVVIDQMRCEYIPYVFAIQTSQRVEIKNSDPVMHNVNFAGKANKPFNEAQMANGSIKTKRLENVEMFAPFMCNVHPWMFAYVSVFDHPYFAVSGKDGTYKIANLPPGKYVIEARHRKLEPVAKEITVTASQRVDFTLDIK